MDDSGSSSHFAVLYLPAVRRPAASNPAPRPLPGDLLLGTSPESPRTVGPPSPSSLPVILSDRRSATHSTNYTNESTIFMRRERSELRLRRAAHISNKKKKKKKKGSTMKAMTHSSAFLLPSPPQSNGGPALTYALVVLNQRLPRFAPLLWNHAKLRLCADGGANRIYDQMPELFPDQDPIDVRLRFKPDVIKGDMDSIRLDVKEYYTNSGVRIVDESHDQDTTDLHKCVAYILDNTSDLEKSNLCILVAGALGGRFDHEVGNLNILYKFSNIRIILLSEDCLIHLLPKTHSHEIHIHASVEGPHCGLIPLGTPSSRTTTTGLQWDLTDTSMGLGGLISTSNIVQKEKITVQSDSDLLWTISIKKTA